MSVYEHQKPQARCQRQEITPADLKNLPKSAARRILFFIDLIREFETALLDLSEQGLVHGPVHSSIGQEAIAAATAEVLEKTDMVGSTHRAHGHFLAKAVKYYSPDDFDPIASDLSPEAQDAVNRTLAEIMGLKAGWCGGRGGSMHLYDGKSGNLGSNAIVGGGIPLATGAAWAEKLRGHDTVVVSFFGDGAINQGCFHEVANMASLWRAPVLYFVENNFYAVGTSTQESSAVRDLAIRSLGYGIDSLIIDGADPLAVYMALKKAVGIMRPESQPYFIEAKTYRHYHHAGRMMGSAFGYRDKEEEADWIARDPFVEFPRRVTAAGIISEPECERLRGMAKNAVAEAIGLCVKSDDGKRYIPDENWPDGKTVVDNLRTDIGAEAQEYVERNDFTKFEDKTYGEAIARVTLRNMERDERVIVLGEEVANLRGGPYGATKGIKEVYPERLINTPISECGFVGMAGGAASVGMRPVVEIMFPDFGLVAADQLFNQIGKLKHMYGGQISFPLVARTRVAFGYGYGGQHSMVPTGLFGLFTGWRMIAPSNAFDYIGLFNTAMDLPDPVLMVEHGMLYADVGQVPLNDLDYKIAYGRANVVREGKDVTVLTYLTGVRECLAAAEELAGSGVDAEVIDLRTVDYVGLDYETIGRSVKKTNSVLIVEHAPRSLGLSGRLADEIQERFFDDLDCPVAKLTAKDVPLPVSKALERAALPSLEEMKSMIGKGARHHF